MGPLMINMAFMPLYMWEMWDVTPVTDGHTDGQLESRAVFSLNWIRKSSHRNPNLRNWRGWSFSIVVHERTEYTFGLHWIENFIVCFLFFFGKHFWVNYLTTKIRFNFSSWAAIEFRRRNLSTLQKSRFAKRFKFFRQESELDQDIWPHKEGEINPE